jgi:hypothetical protein
MRLCDLYFAANKAKGACENAAARHVTHLGRVNFG